MTEPMAAAYSAGAAAWAGGPSRVYATLAGVLVEAAPVSLAGRSVLDLGSGTGAASRRAVEAGARVIAVDTALGMLCSQRATRPPGAVGDALALPFARRAFDAVIAAFCLNHLPDPAAGVREAGRVTRPGGPLLASTYASDDDHPAKHAVETALAELGWAEPAWYADVRGAMKGWGTPDDAACVVEAGGMDVVSVERRSVPFPELDAAALVEWRLGMAHVAPFVAALEEGRRQAVTARALEVLGPRPEPLVRRVILIVARAR